MLVPPAAPSYDLFLDLSLTCFIRGCKSQLRNPLHVKQPIPPGVPTLNSTISIENEQGLTV
jgi:hypothetical protein